MHERKNEDILALQIQEFNSQIIYKDSRIEKINVKIWDLENRHDIQRKEQISNIEDQKEQIAEYKIIIKDQKDEIRQLKNLACDKCDFETQSISNLIMHQMKTMVELRTVLLVDIVTLLVRNNLI